MTESYLTLPQARQLAEDYIHQLNISPGDSLFIEDKEIIEQPYAWIFPYNSKRYASTKDIKYAVGGNSPIFVSKRDCKISVYRSGLTVDEMIDEHEEKNALWVLTAVHALDLTKLFALKNALNWTQKQLILFRKNDRKLIDRGAKRRLMQIQATLDSKHIITLITLNVDNESSTNKAN